MKTYCPRCQFQAYDITTQETATWGEAEFCCGQCGHIFTKDLAQQNVPSGQKPTFQTRVTLHAARPADRVTDNREQFRKRWRRVSEATNFMEAQG